MFKNIRERIGNFRDIKKPEDLDLLAQEIDYFIPGLEKLILGLDEETQQRNYLHIGVLESNVKEKDAPKNPHSKEAKKSLEAKLRVLKEIRLAMKFILRKATRYGENSDNLQWHRVLDLADEMRDEMNTTQIVELVNLAKKLSTEIKAIPKPMHE